MNLTCWLQDAHVRVFPTANRVTRQAPPLDIARGEATAFQLAVANGDPAEVATLAVFVSPPRGVQCRVRRVGFVPLPHFNTGVPEAERDGLGRVPGLVPDPLFDETTALLAPLETVAFWISVQSAAGLAPGRYPVSLRVEVGGRTVASPKATVTVHDVQARPRRDFPVVQWFYIDALLDWYRLEPFEERFWSLLAAYMADLPAHGQDTIYTPVFTPPLDGVKRPSQLLHVRRRGKGYAFDWRQVKRYVDLAREQGIRNFEWTHFFTQWGVRHAIRVYEGHGETEKPLWPPDTAACAPTYRKFLAQFLPELRAFIDREGIADRSFFHVSDEPHGDEALANYRAARALLRELAPWMKTMDALSEIVYGREQLTDMPVPSIQVTRQFRAEHIPCMTYFCCGPRGPYLNRLLDTPLTKVRMSGWLFHRFQVRGFLHWGYNYWYQRQSRTLIDPFAESAAQAWPGWAYGDPFVVYPGPAGPIDSIRWEVFGLSLQDYALLQTLKIQPEGPVLRAFRDFNDFPKQLAWFRRARQNLLKDGAT